MKIEIEWLEDTYDCDTCGVNYACGAEVKIDGELALSLEPLAGCCGGDDYGSHEVFTRVLALLGHEVVIVG